MMHPLNVPVPPRLGWFGQTDRGKVRPNNEDSFLGSSLTPRRSTTSGKPRSFDGPADFVFAVTDGWRGAGGGIRQPDHDG